jgi:hypothetical protein
MRVLLWSTPSENSRRASVRSSNSIRRFGQCLLFALGSWLLAGPLALLQLSAWAWMVTSYSQESTWEIALKETFGGSRPCKLCEFISEVASEKKETPATSGNTETKDLKLLLGLSKPVWVPPPPKPHTSLPFEETSIENPLLETSSPPPRGFA